MDSAQKTLIDIASTSRRIVTALTRENGRKTVEAFRIDRIVIGSRSVLEILNKELLLEDGCVDARLVDWLNGSEPQACLDTLNQMEQILNKKVEHNARSFFKAVQSARTIDKSDEAIRIFQMCQAYFHFLLNTDIWNCERNVYQGSHTSIEFNARCTEGAPEIINPTRRDSEYTSSVPQENSAKQAGKLKTILERLDALHCEDVHSRTLRLRQPDTCTWLPKENDFKTWKKTRDSFLWLRGKAGAGKSVLAASVIEHLKDTLQDGQTLIFFYCDFRNERSTNIVEIMRSLLSQLLQQFLCRAVESKGLIDDLERDGTLVIGNIDLLGRYISSAARHFNQQTFCVIDALDECNDLEELLGALKQLKDGGIRFLVTSRPLQVIREGLAGLPSISMDMMKAEVAADISLHVEREIDSHRRLRILETSLKDKIGSALCHKADGMFRWVQCQLNTLKRCMTGVQISKALEDLPRDLDTTYSRILLGIDENELDIVRQTLYWLVAAFRPLKLCEILDGLSIDIEQRVLDRDSAPVHGPALLDALGSLVSYDELTDRVILSHASVKEYLTAVTIRSKYPSYHIDEQYAHTKLALLCMSYIPAYFKHHGQSYVHAMLSQNDYGDGMHTHDFNTAHHVIRHRCSAVAPPSERYPLLAYVQSSGFQHLAYVNPGDRKVLHAIKVFESDVRLHPVEWEQLREGSKYCRARWPTLEHDLVLYILVAFAPAQLLRLHIGYAQLKQKDGTNPLVYAALLDKVEHAAILLSKGARVERRGWDLDGRRQVLPLEVTSVLEEPMVDLFLAEGSPVPHELFERIVRVDGHSFVDVVLKMIQTDEFVEWAAGTRNKDFFWGVLCSRSYLRRRFSEEVFGAVERRLTQIGCNPSIWYERMSLQDAVNRDHIPVVKRLLFGGYVSLQPDAVLHATSWEMIHFLLDLGNDMHVVSSNGDTLLHHAIVWAMDDGGLDTIRTLIDAGCNPSACNLAGETPLHVAVSHRGHSQLVEYLLSLGVPLPPNILHAASSFPVISLLLDKGAEVQAIAANGDTVLHTALRHCYGYYPVNDYLAVAELLVDSGCIPCLSNALGETPLHIAAENGHLLVVQYLLSLDIPLPSDILLFAVDGDTSDTVPLIELLLRNRANIHAMSPSGDNLLCLVVNSSTSSEKCLEKVKILVDAGCDPHKCNKAGESLIHMATRHGLTTVVEYLVSLGLKFDERHQSRGYSHLLENGGDVCAILEDEDAMQALTRTEESALNLAKRLIESGCSPSALTSGKEALLHLASREGYISVISYFLSLGTPLPSDILLSAAECYHDSANMIRYLIEHGANVDATSTADGVTPLHKLIDYSSNEEDLLLQNTQILIQTGCNPQSQDLYGYTPMHCLALYGYTSVIEYLLSQGIPPPHHILVYSNARAFRFFLRNGVDVQSLIPILPLHHALHSFNDCYSDEADRLELATFLINAGCDPCVENWLGETPVHIAAKSGHISVIKYLLSQNATLPSNVLLAAVLHWDSQVYPEDIVALFCFLIHEGADVNASTDDGDTPLHLVLRRLTDIENEVRSRSRHYQFREWCACLEVLLNGGADPFKQNVDGKNAFHLTEEWGQPSKDNFSRLVLNAHRMDTTRRVTYRCYSEES